MWKGFAVYLFGSRYEKAGKSSLICLFVFWGLRQAEVSVQIAPGILYLMAFTVTAGSMWQDLAANNEALKGKNLFMLPFSGWKLTAAYIGALGAYTFLTRTALVLAAALAVSSWGCMELMGCLLSALCGILLTAWVYGERRYHFQKRLDAYAFYEEDAAAARAKELKSVETALIWMYFFRYLWYHRNYLVNTLILWGAAAGLPFCLLQIERSFALPIGFSLLTLNTPVCILLSCDPHLEQALRMLPGQRRSFLFPYGLFLFLLNLTGDFIFLLSFWLQGGGSDIRYVFFAVLSAGLGAAGSVGMEWYFPIRNWKTQSDLWHHPRKYAVPGSLLLLSGLLSPWF